ncbi:hypothetical protein [Nisaea sp.]|uniref:hypothetical protein n=1 Tax=Nisaea sp. TaxID=2024842 RepID=UPI003B519EA8
MFPPQHESGSENANLGLAQANDGDTVFATRTDRPAEPVVPLTHVPGGTLDGANPIDFT